MVSNASRSVNDIANRLVIQANWWTLQQISEQFGKVFNSRKSMTMQFYELVSSLSKWWPIPLIGILL